MLNLIFFILNNEKFWLNFLHMISKIKKMWRMCGPLLTQDPWHLRLQWSPSNCALIHWHIFGALLVLCHLAWFYLGWQCLYPSWLLSSLPMLCFWSQRERRSLDKVTEVLDTKTSNGHIKNYSWKIKKEKLNPLRL